MLKFQITVQGATDLIEDQFDAFIENNEICTVQPACHNMVDYWELEIVPEHDEDKVEFLQLCSAMVDHFNELGYEF